MTEARMNTANRFDPYFWRIQSFVLLVFALLLSFYCIFYIFIFLINIYHKIFFQMHFCLETLSDPKINSHTFYQIMERYP